MLVNCECNQNYMNNELRSGLKCKRASGKHLPRCIRIVFVQYGNTRTAFTSGILVPRLYQTAGYGGVTGLPDTRWTEVNIQYENGCNSPALQL